MGEIIKTESKLNSTARELLVEANVSVANFWVSPNGNLIPVTFPNLHVDVAKQIIKIKLNNKELSRPHFIKLRDDCNDDYCYMLMKLGYMRVHTGGYILYVSNVFRRPNNIQRQFLINWAIEYNYREILFDDHDPNSLAQIRPYWTSENN